MPGRPKKARRREQGEKGARGKIGKKGIEMRCSLCLTPGHNKSTCKATAEEIAEKQSAAAERRKAHKGGGLNTIFSKYFAILTNQLLIYNKKQSYYSSTSPVDGISNQLILHKNAIS
ncbi:hypothetical protein DCAR_0727264 [Daucus carota subsp. sativus]|uniref:Uncharacterized protein n=1 Tax=Daucus carota subsp. sativus TaxID=79200 RepID=A0AAF0XGT4_DAUCS|nr:hypothetical protein DCAR_0727264 [Daucus carota subsp. sativus]